MPGGAPGRGRGRGRARGTRGSRHGPVARRAGIIPAVEPLVVVIAGLAALAGGAVVLRSFGPGYRVGRLLASTPATTIEQAEALAAAGGSGYVRLEGRLDSVDDFPDEHERPLVFRRRRLEAYRGGRWSVIEEERQAVPFEIRDGLAVVAIDGGALDEGLVVLPRESLGTAADAPDRVPAGLPPSTPVRLRIEQVSSVEHATVVGVPRRRADGTTVLTAGLGRPLILSTLEQVEAMQLLAGGRRGRPLAAMALLVGGLSLLALGLAWAVVRTLATGLVGAAVLAASPGPSPVPGGDTRSAGEGPGLVGAPLTALAVVALIAVASVVVTLAYVRLTSGRSENPTPRS